MQTRVLSRSELEEIARKVAVASGAQGVVLFGSRARESEDGQGDVDLALIFDDAGAIASGVQRAHRILWPRRFPVDIVPMTVEALRGGTTVLAREIMRTGVVLYGRAAA